MAADNRSVLSPLIKDLRGQVFGRWAVLDFGGLSAGSKAMWLCRCECGSTGKVLGYELTSGNSRSCGCLKIELQTTHGLYGTPEHSVWRTMLQRCTNPHAKYFSNYGGKGIAVCERWKNSCAAFFEDMGPRPTPKHTLDRINNDGNYEPKNCRWATRHEQMRNTRRTKNVTYQGKTMCIKDWARELNMSSTCLAKRLKKLTVEQAFTLPRIPGQKFPRG